MRRNPVLAFENSSRPARSASSANLRGRVHQQNTRCSVNASAGIPVSIAIASGLCFTAGMCVLILGFSSYGQIFPWLLCPILALIMFFAGAAAIFVSLPSELDSRSGNWEGAGAVMQHRNTEVLLHPSLLTDEPYHMIRLGRR